MSTPFCSCQGSEGVPQVVESDLRQTRPVQHPVEHMQYTVRGDGAAGGRGEHIGSAHLFFLLPEDFCGVRPDGEGAVGILVFRGAFTTCPLTARPAAAP